MNPKIEHYRLNVQYYGRYSYYGGCLVFLVAIVTFFVELARLSHISRYHKYDSSWEVEDDPFPKKSELSKLNKLILEDPENDKAIQMGNKESLIFVYYLNCAVCILFGIIGLVMYYSSGPALRMAHYLPFGLDAIPEEVEHTTQVENYLE